ncbi:MAG: glucodextranase DOMON-like domain-containing protein [Candidatus Bipolaricaulia bacterium]
MGALLMLTAAPHSEVGSTIVPSEEPLQLALVWHQHQPLYKNRMTDFYELPWTRVHAVQEYLDSPKILQEFPVIRVTYNLQPSLIEQLEDYATITSEEADRGGGNPHPGIAPLIYDYLAPSGGPSQEEMLSRYDPQSSTLAKLAPVEIPCR